MSVQIIQMVICDGCQAEITDRTNTIRMTIDGTNLDFHDSDHFKMYGDAYLTNLKDLTVEAEVALGLAQGVQNG